jgi:tetratricopeptide (TPR) repeat protein
MFIVRRLSLCLCVFVSLCLQIRVETWAQAPADSVDNAMRLLASGNKVEARRMLSRITSAEPSNFQAHYRLGLLALDANDLTAAAVSLQRASEIQPASAHVWLALAQAHLKSGKRTLASTAAAKAAAGAGTDPVLLHGLALFYSGAVNWAKAAEYEERYAERAPADKEAAVRAASFYLNANRPKPAIELASKKLQEADRADLRNLLGKAYEADGQVEKTIVELQQAIRLNPAEESYYFDLVQVLLIHQNFNVAIQVLETATKRFDKSAQLELALGVAYYGQRRFEDAIEAFLRTASLAPEVEQPYIFLGRILEHAEAQLPAITQRFANLASQDPRNFIGHFLYAKALAADAGTAGDPERSAQVESLLRKSIALNANYWESQFELGLVLERRKAFAEAAIELERAAQLNRHDPGIHYRLARVYDRLGKAAKAQAERVLHEKLVAEEKAAVDKHAASIKRLDLVVK